MIVIDASALVNVLLHRAPYASTKRRMREAGILAAPHLIGAPHLDRYFGSAAPELAAMFSARALGVSAAAWAFLGLAAGWIWSREA